jgi:predicted nucleic-acid-binding Zn-ribbon protein
MQDSLKSGRCPKCSSTQVYCSDNSVTQVLRADYTGLDKPRIANYACSVCGYTEFYVTPETLHLVNERWTKVEISDEIAGG